MTRCDPGFKAVGLAQVKSQGRSADVRLLRFLRYSGHVVSRPCSCHGLAVLLSCLSMLIGPTTKLYSCHTPTTARHLASCQCLRRVFAWFGIPILLCWMPRSRARHGVFVLALSRIVTAMVCGVCGQALAVLLLCSCHAVAIPSPCYRAVLLPFPCHVLADARAHAPGPSSFQLPCFGHVAPLPRAGVL